MHELRIATVDDIDSIARFQTDAWNSAYRELVPAEYLERMTVETRAQRWGSRIRAGERRIILAELDGRLDAVASTELRSDELPGPLLELGSLYVAEGVRGNGLGALLLEHTLGDEPAVLWVFEANGRAIEFYRRHGFERDPFTKPDPDTSLPLIRMSRNWLVE